MPKKFTPRPYQEIAISHVLKYLRCAVWLPMGMGKSAVILSALNRLSVVEQVYPALILAPLRVARDTWPDEQKKWTDFSHIKISAIVGDAESRIRATKVKADIYTCNYENLVWLIDYYGDKWPFVTVIADESIKLKNFRSRQGGKRSGALGKIAFSKIFRRISEQHMGLYLCVSSYDFFGLGMKWGSKLKRFGIFETFSGLSTNI